MLSLCILSVFVGVTHALDCKKLTSLKANSSDIEERILAETEEIREDFIKLSVRPPTYNGDSEIKSSDKLTPPYLNSDK